MSTHNICFHEEKKKIYDVETSSKSGVTVLSD